MVNHIEPIDYKIAKSRYGEMNEDEQCILWTLVQMYDIDMVLSGITVAQENDRGMDYVERYCDYMVKEDERVEELWNESRRCSLLQS